MKHTNSSKIDDTHFYPSFYTELSVSISTSNDFELPAALFDENIRTVRTTMYRRRIHGTYSVTRVLFLLHAFE